MNTECLFCKIAARKIPARIVSESDAWIAFHDAAPKAPVHCLIIPKRHMAGLSEAVPQERELLGSMLMELARLAGELKVDDAGYRIVTNRGRDGGQTVGHLHLHLLGGRPMHWPPG